MGTTKPALIQASAAATVWGKVGVRRGDGSAGMYPVNGVTAAARFDPGAMGRMPYNDAKAELECSTGAEVVRRALAALRNSTDKEAERYDDNKEEPSGNGDNDGFVVTQDDNTKDNQTSGSEAPKVQRASGSKAHQQTHKEAHLLADRGGGTLGLAADDKNGKTWNSKARPGRRAINEDRNAQAPEARQGSWARTPPNPTRRPRRWPTTLPTGAVGCTEGPWKERTKRTGPPRPHKQKTQRPGCRLRRPHMPRTSPTTRPTRAVGHAAPWGRRHCLA
jgi:hypothetical protein